MTRNLEPHDLTTPATVPVAYRSSLTSADVIAVPGTVTCTKLTGVGSATAGVYTIFVVAGNSHGRTTAKQGNATVTTETTNLGIRAAFATVTGAEYYDVYCSTDGAASKFVGRVTEAQRASGIIINGVNTTTAGGAVNSVDIYVVGTGLAVNGGQLAVNTAYSIPATVDCRGYQYAEFDITMTRTGDIVAPSLIVTPFFLNSRTGAYQAGSASTITFGGAAATYPSLRQRLQLEVRGNSAVALLIEAIAGTGASVDIDVSLS